MKSGNGYLKLRNIFFLKKDSLFSNIRSLALITVPQFKITVPRFEMTGYLTFTHIRSRISKKDSRISEMVSRLQITVPRFQITVPLF